MEYVQGKNLNPIFQDADAIDRLKHQVIKNFNSLLCKVRKGYKPEYEHILQEISLIELLEDNNMEIDKSLFIIQYYLNNE